MHHKIIEWRKSGTEINMELPQTLIMLAVLTSLKFKFIYCLLNEIQHLYNSQ